MEKQPSLEKRLSRNRLSKRILPAVALAGAMSASQPALSQDRIFTDDFETQTVNNIIGFEEGFESTRPITVNICDYDGRGIDSVVVRYQSVQESPGVQSRAKYKASPQSKFGKESTRGTNGWVEVPLEPQGGDGQSAPGVLGNPACEGYETTSTLPLEYGLALDDNGLIDWEFQVNYSDGTVDFFPEGTVNRTKYWANEDTAQATIEDVLNNDDNVFVDCYDCPVTLPSGADVEYDAVGFFLGSNDTFAIEYNGQDASPEIIAEMETFYEGQSPGNQFHLMGNNNLVQISSFLQDLSNQNQ